VSTDARVVEDQTVYLADLIDRSAAPNAPLHGITFRRCTIRGPVIIYPMGAFSTNRCSWQVSDISTLFYELADGEHTGLLPVADLSFEDCDFQNIGVAGSPALRPLLEAGFQNLEPSTSSDIG